MPSEVAREGEEAAAVGCVAERQDEVSSVGVLVRAEEAAVAAKGLGSRAVVVSEGAMKSGAR